jgi:hypothetical protein
MVGSIDGLTSMEGVAVVEASGTWIVGDAGVPIGCSHDGRVGRGSWGRGRCGHPSQPSQSWESTTDPAALRPTWHETLSEKLACVVTGSVSAK